MNNDVAYKEGDAVNWDSYGTVKYGFLGEDCPYGTPLAKRLMVTDLERGVWMIELGRLRPTE